MAKLPKPKNPKSILKEVEKLERQIDKILKSNSPNAKKLLKSLAGRAIEQGIIVGDDLSIKEVAEAIKRAPKATKTALIYATANKLPNLRTVHKSKTGRKLDKATVTAGKKLVYAIAPDKPDPTTEELNEFERARQRLQQLRANEAKQGYEELLKLEKKQIRALRAGERKRMDEIARTQSGLTLELWEAKLRHERLIANAQKEISKARKRINDTTYRIKEKLLEKFKKDIQKSRADRRQKSKLEREQRREEAKEALRLQKEQERADKIIAKELAKEQKKWERSEQDKVHKEIKEWWQAFLKEQDRDARILAQLEKEQKVELEKQRQQNLIDYIIGARELLKEGDLKKLYSDEFLNSSDRQYLRESGINLDVLKSLIEKDVSDKTFIDTVKKFSATPEATEALLSALKFSNVYRDQWKAINAQIKEAEKAIYKGMETEFHIPKGLLKELELKFKSGITTEELESLKDTLKVFKDVADNPLGVTDNEQSEINDKFSFYSKTKIESTHILARLLHQYAQITQPPPNKGWDQAFWWYASWLSNEQADNGVFVKKGFVVDWNQILMNFDIYQGKLEAIPVEDTELKVLLSYAVGAFGRLSNIYNKYYGKIEEDDIGIIQEDGNIVFNEKAFESLRKVGEEFLGELASTIQEIQHIKEYCDSAMKQINKEILRYKRSKWIDE